MGGEVRLLQIPCILEEALKGSKSSKGLDCFEYFK